MNNKGQTLGLSIVIAITILIVGFMSINFIRDVVIDARAPDQLDCADIDNETILSDGTKLTCLAVDLIVPYFILVILLAAGGIILARLLL